MPAADEDDRSAVRSIRFDLEAGVVEIERAGERETHAFDTAAAFDAASQAWLRVGWDTKYVYRFSWLGRPVIQLPSDLVRIQEVIYAVRPDLIIETGVAHGGSLVFYAGLFAAMGGGRVVGVDVEIRPHNRRAIEEHPLADAIDLIEGDSVAAETVDRVRALIEPGTRVLVMLDSNHTKDHVRAELEAYAPLVSIGSYVVAADGIMADVVGAPRTAPNWEWDNPRAAAAEFAAAHPEFVLEEPVPPFDEGVAAATPSYWAGGWLRRVR